MKKSHQAGFSTVEALLMVIILGLVSFTGWYLWHSKRIADKTLSQAATSTIVTTKNKSITNFAECKAAAGSKIVDTFPEECVTKNNKTFVDSTSNATVLVQVIQADGAIKPLAPESIAKTPDQAAVLRAIAADMCTSNSPYVTVNYQVFADTRQLYHQDGGYAYINANCNPKAATSDGLSASGSAIYLHKTTDGSWVVDSHSQMAPDCSKLDGKGYPSSIITTCYDGDTGRAIKP